MNADIAGDILEQRLAKRRMEGAIGLMLPP
jgi:hypothetical protein